MQYSLAQWYAIGYHDYKSLHDGLTDFCNFKREDKEDEVAWQRGYFQAMEDWEEFYEYSFQKLINI